ncbi:MAG: AIR synthase-related protein [Caldilineaceae bacterium]
MAGQRNASTPPLAISTNQGSASSPALAAANAQYVTAMHDPTEGGVATGLLELAIASGNGLEVDLDAIPIPAIAAELCAVYGLDPLGTIASGALIATAAPHNVGAPNPRGTK